MAKRSGRRGGDARLRVVRDAGATPKRGTVAPGDALQPLIVDLRRRMRAKDPWELLALLSTIISVTSGQPGADGEPVPIEALVESFIGVDLAETTAALHVLKVLVADDDLVAQIRAELAHRTQPMPLWLRDIDETQVSRAVLMGDLGGAQEDVILGLDWVGGGQATFLVLVDHDEGTVVKDAFPAPVSIDETVAHLRSVMSDDSSGAGVDLGEGELEDVEFEEVDLDAARGLVEEALAIGEELEVEFESDTWPTSRPILEWLLSTMPEPDDLDLDLEDDDFLDSLLNSHEEVVAEFVESAAARAVGLTLTETGPDDLALNLIVGTGALLEEEDFLTWTSERVEELLLRGLPTTVLVDSATARRVPVLLKAFTQWSMGRVEAPTDEIAAVAATVDRAGGEYVRLSTSSEAAALKQALRDYAELMGVDDPAIPVLEAEDDGT